MHKRSRDVTPFFSKDTLIDKKLILSFHECQLGVKEHLLFSQPLLFKLLLKVCRLSHCVMGPMLLLSILFIYKIINF